MDPQRNQRLRWLAMPLLAACDVQQTVGIASARELAATYAPVLRLHRDEFYAPCPIELTLSGSQLVPGGAEAIPRMPTLLGSGSGLEIAGSGGAPGTRPDPSDRRRSAG